MKICYINPTFLIRRPIAELIGRLGEKEEVGIFVPKKLFSSIDKNWHNNSKLSNAKIYSYSAIKIPLINFEWPIPITPMFFINLFRIMFRYKIIHMWTYFYINSVFVLLFGMFFRKKIIMACDTFPGYSFSAGKIVDTMFRVYTKLLGWFLFSIPKKIQVYGESLIPFALKMRINRSKIKVIPTGVDVSYFKDALKTDIGFNKDDFVLVYAGLMVPRKGIDIMIKAVKKVSNAKLLLIGDGPLKKEYMKMASDNVKFLGWRKDIASIFKSSDCLILSSRGEGLPGIVMEAMACGLPIIASNIPCIPDLVKDNGVLCPMDDVECFANAIRKVMDGKVKRNSVELIKKFDWDNIIPKYYKMYNEVLA